MSEAHGAEQLAELHGPDHNPFYGTYVRDWIALCDDLRDADVRGYLILRSLVFEGKGVKNRVRVLTLAELCQLIPGPNGKPSSLSRIRELLRCLSAVGLITTPEGGPVTTSSGGKAQGRPLRIKIHDQPATAFKPRWPNTEEKLASIRPKAEQAAREAAERDASRAAAKAAGQNSDQQGAGRNSDQAGRNSDQAGRNSDHDSGDDLGERAPQCCSCASPSSTSGQPGGSAGGHSAGGLARADEDDGAAPESPNAAGGSAADSSESAATKKGEESGAPAAKPKKPARKGPLQVSELKPVTGEDEVYAMLDDLGVLRAPAARISTLRRAVREFLGHYADARSGPFAMYPRRPEHAALRLSIGWHQAGGPLRSSAGYTGGDRIARPVGYLAALLTTHECDHPACEAGVLLDTREECNTCQYRAAERIAQAKAVQLLAEHQVRAAAAAELRARQLADEREHAHGEALEEDARREEAAARLRARAAAAAAAAEETARLRAELAEQFAELDAAAARPVVPAPLRPAHDEDPVEAEAFPDEEAPEEDPFAPNHFEDAPVSEGAVPEQSAGPWSLSSPNALYEAAKAALAS
ncbi:hypothetical protein NRK68_36645 (plasmid) [Streptomyces yangpuensis]|uniref:Uncharacterized protein n=1 Tax=Streptomyces yangpuensis TaxID=1648182 RepID=A0ABY5Q9D6_9ACTN|nr:hypothetical protein [Streptomyces yangpuensis]UUY52787.1 hypothetical protein NRK68_36645 [Streptomyces yangpuensis]